MTITIEAHAVKEFMPQLTAGLEEIAKELKLDGNALIIPYSFGYVDYGVNPLADSDMRPFVRVTDDATRATIFPPSGCDIILKTTPRYLQDYLVRIMSSIQSFIQSQ